MCSTGTGTTCNLDSQDVSPMCMLCGESSETVMHFSSGCPVLAKSKYRI